MLPIYKECHALASQCDDALYYDQSDVINNLVIERSTRRIYSVERAFENVWKIDDVKHANWALADYYNMSNFEEGTFQCSAVDKEVKEYLQEQATMAKWVTKSAVAVPSAAAGGKPK